MKRRKRRSGRKTTIIVLAVIVALALAVSLVYFFFQPRGSQDSFVSNAQVSQFTTEFPTQASSTSPNAITVDLNGNVWFSLWNESAIAKLTPSNGTLHEFPLPGVKAGSMITWGMAFDEKGNRLWLTEFSSNSIWSFDVSNQTFRQFKIVTPNAFPFGISLDKNQDVWFTELGGDKIGEITAQGNLAEYPIPGGRSAEPSGITTDSKGAIWFTLPGIESIGSYYLGNFSIQNLTGLVSSPVGIAEDQKGNLWMTQHGPNFISEYNPHTHYFKTISTSNNSLVSSLPYFCWVDSNGNVWFNEHQGNAMSEFFPQNNTLLEYFIPSRVVSAGNISYMLTSTLSPNGQPWYTELFTGKVGTINTSASIDVHLKLLNYSEGNQNIPNGSSVSYGLSISSNLPVSMKAYVGNFTNRGNFSFTFTPQNGGGNFKTVLTIRNIGSQSGVFFVTITARTDRIAVSQVIAVTGR